MPDRDALPRYGHYIDGAVAAPSAGTYFATENPYTGRPWAMIARGSAADVDRAVAAARAAGQSGAWSGLSATARGRLLRKVGDLIAANAGRLAETEMRDNGKLAAEVTTQVRYVAEYFHYYAGLADKLQSDVIPTDKAGVFAYTKYEPKGVIAIITPWNSPLALTTWKLAPALAAGCTTVIKPSELPSPSL
nr:aldehyde dehydrogenase family protein [Rhodospirillales bacterium]